MKYYLAIVYCLLIPFSLVAQEMVISGSVTDENKTSIPGVNVFIKGGKTGVATDANGNYSISSEPSDTLQLVFSFIGYQKQEILVAGRKNINIELKPSYEILNEYVVVGYGKRSVK